MGHAERSGVRRGVEFLAEHQWPDNAGMRGKKDKWVFGHERYKEHVTD